MGTEIIKISSITKLEKLNLRALLPRITFAFNRHKLCKFTEDIDHGKITFGKIQNI